MTLVPRFLPLAAPVLRRVFGSATPDVEEVHPAETVAVRPPLALPGMLDRATGTVEGNDLSYYLDVAIATTCTHVPVRRHVYRNALVHPRGFACLCKSERYGNGIGLAELAAPISEEPTLRYCRNYVIQRYFGHWLTDALPSALIDPDRGALWLPPFSHSQHADDYLEAVNLHGVSHRLVHARELITYQDYGQGSHKRGRYEQLRQRLLARFGTDGRAKHVYIRRGRTGVPRWIADEDTLIEALLARNWTVLDVATASVADMQRVLLSAEAVVSIEGSQLDHAIMSLPAGSSMIVLQPCDRFLLRYVGMCQARDIATGFVVLEGSQAEGYRVDLDELLRTVDLVTTA
ncbi:glycosyltransferase 61 family protein [Tabrizicola soli]|uniref:Glycosyltransferase 61 family protein n=1 Tax=Tabrizicola soli TaxID=2185115 RepID=A0ABV7DVC9_9RHOB|nr:glycosyltransferase 61 family protein [Tabrizicola soli]